MTDDRDARKLDELDRLLNDPEVPMQPELIWRILDEISHSEPCDARQTIPMRPGSDDDVPLRVPRYAGR